MELIIQSENEMMSLGGELFQCVPAGSIVFLKGALGAGKTTLVRGMLRAAGHTGPVKSPTYTLVESYQPGSQIFYHFDLYRLSDPEEIEYIGLRDYLRDDSICLIEWPEKGEGVLPRADLDIRIEYQQSARNVLLMTHSDLSLDNLVEC
ncbi:MAG: tRNA (adenosine(37)-N6)-threonylcarbamoyltransferase complex ATPase subunit type 1 TsaE [Gammaproteobacteria bacterium]